MLFGDSYLLNVQISESTGHRSETRATTRIVSENVLLYHSDSSAIQYYSKSSLNVDVRTEEKNVMFTQASCEYSHILSEANNYTEIVV